MSIGDYIIYLCRCAVNRKIPNRHSITVNDYNELYNYASRQMVASMVGIALQSTGINNAIFDHAVLLAQRKNIILDYEKNSVFKMLDEAKIWHMALKGTVLRNWYPVLGMRESADCDILFDKNREEDVRNIMIDLGYSVESYGEGHHDVYFKKPVTNMQMHVDLFGVGYEKRLNDYYLNIKDKLLIKERYEYEFSPEDFYIYMLAHNERDHSTRGTGLRSILDTYVFLKKCNDVLDWDYINRETEKLKINDYEKMNRSLALNLFSDKTLTEQNKEMLNYLLYSGAYGTLENRVSNKVKEFGGGFLGKIKYILNRTLLPMDVVEHAFPVFYKYKIMLPILPLYRLLKGGLFSKRKRLFKELSELKKYISV